VILTATVRESDWTPTQNSEKDFTTVALKGKVALKRFRGAANDSLAFYSTATWQLSNGLLVVDRYHSNLDHLT
jgi:hypothetical protein